MNPWDNDKPAVQPSSIGSAINAGGAEQAPARAPLPWQNDKPAVQSPTTAIPAQAQAAPQSSSYLQSIARGGLKGINTVTDYLAPGVATNGPSLQAPTAPPNPSITNEDIDRMTPNAATDIPGRTLEKVSEGLPFSLPFGAAGVAGSAAAAATGAALEKYNPNHPIVNAGAELLASVAAAPVTNILTKTSKSLAERVGLFQSPVNALYKDLGVKPRIAGANDGPEFLQQVQNGLREGLGGRGTIIRTEDELFNAVERQANQQFNRLGPDMSNFELGQATQQAALLRGPQIKTEIGNLSNALASVVPSATSLPPTNYFNALSALEAKYTGAAAQQPLFQPKVKAYIDRLLTDLSNSSSAANPMGTMPYDTLKNMRTDIGEMIEKGIFNPDQSTKELRALYRSLSEDMRSAYPSSRAQSVFDHVNALQEGWYNNLENVVQPLVKQGLTPEAIGQRILNQAQKGPTTLQNMVGELENVNPNIKNLYTSQILRSFGENRIGEFDPRLFYTNFQKLQKNAPETLDFLFQGQSQAREGVEKLAELSGLIRDSFASRNTSGTTPTSHVLGMIGRFVHGITAAATTGAGAAIGHTAGEDLAGAGTGFGVGMAASVPLDIGTQWVLAHLWTSPMFNTWIATEGSKLKPSMSALGALGTEEPDLATGLKALGHYFSAPGDNPRGFLEGGLATFAEGGPSYDTQLTPDEEQQFQQWKQLNAPNDSGADYDLRGAFKAKLNPAENGHWSDEFKKPNHPTFSNESKYSREHPELPAGSWTGDFFNPPAVYAEGGSVPAWMADKPSQFPAGSLDNDKQHAALDKFKTEVLSKNPKFQQAVDYYKSNLNLTDEQARGAVKYMQVNESKLDEGIVNPTSGAFGVAQWLGPRKQQLMAEHGAKPSFEQQLAFSVKELLGPEKRTLEAIKQTKTEKQAYDVWGSLYERPGNAALVKAGVNYKPGDTAVAANKAKPNSIVEQFLASAPEEEQATAEPTEEPNKPVLDTLNAAPWVAPETKFAANKILQEGPTKSERWNGSTWGDNN